MHPGKLLSATRVLSQRDHDVRLGSWLISIYLLSALFGCTALTDPPVPIVPNYSEAPEFYAPPIEDEYRIQVGDKLIVRSYYDSQLNQDITVRSDGRISLLLLQDVDAVGKTPQSLGEYLSKRYEDLVGASDVIVSLKEAAGATVYVGGEVRQQAQQELNGPLTVVQALTAAGGPLPTGNTRQVLVLRRQIDGRFLAYQIDTEQVLINKSPDLYLQRYDIVHVPISKIGNVGRFVQLYINSIIPDALRFSVGYTWLNDSRNTSGGVNVISSQ